MPSSFGDATWEFGVIARTFDALPLATVGLLLLALGIRGRGGSMLWTRGMAVLLALVALLCLAALLLFALDIPLAFAAMQRAGAESSQQGALVAAGLKRVMAKVILFALSYGLAYGFMAVRMWRIRGDVDPAA